MRGRIDLPVDVHDPPVEADEECPARSERLVLVHLNDSSSELGSRSDRHEHLGAGAIGVDGLGHIVRHPSLAHVPYVVETPDMDLGFDAINVARARALLAGEALGPLPEPPAPVVRAKKRLAPAVPAA